MTTEPLIYLDDYCDEVLPCSPDLDCWAAWLSQPDEAWGREAAAQDGDVFAASQIIVLGDVRAEWSADGWKLDPPPPEGTTYYYVRWHEGSAGWDVEQSGDDPDIALECREPDDGPQWLACTMDGPNLRVRYEAAGPRLVIAGEVQ
jgi:hypothetical protein